MRGSIARRGKKSWRLKFDVEPEDGERRTRYVTVRGKRQDAEKELTRLLGQADAGTLIEPSKVTVAEHMKGWLGPMPRPDDPPLIPPVGLAPKTAERYRELAELYVYPHLGAVVLQKLKPAKIREWHETLLKSGGDKGRALAARTVGHAHRVLHRALERAVEAESLSRNVAAVISPPKVEAQEVEILDAGQIGTVLDKLTGHDLYAMAAIDLATGLRRGELLALQWRNIDADAATLRVERSLEETKGRRLRFKEPKTTHGKRTISLPPNAVTTLREHRRKHLEIRLSLGLGRPAGDALVFCLADGSPIAPSWLSYTWRNTCISLKLPKVRFHALRHTHASALIAAGVDVVKISRRLGHSSPVVTLRIYAHLFNKDDTVAADAIEAAMRTQPQR